MIDGVAQQVDQRILHFLEDALVDLHVLAADHELGLLALVAGEVAHHFRQQRAERGERQHQQLLGVLQEIIHQLADDELVPLGVAAQRAHLAFQGAQMIVIPVEELGETFETGERGGVTAFQCLAQLPRLRLHARPFLAPALEVSG